MSPIAHAVVAFAASALLIPACGGATPEPAAPAAPAETAPSSSVAAAPSPAPPEEAAAPTGAQKRPLEITSQCEHGVAFFVGDDPKAGPATAKRAVDPMQVLPVERRRDGSQTVWLLDEKSEPLVKVSITRGMKKIEVGKSCRTLDAR